MATTPARRRPTSLVETRGQRALQRCDAARAQPPAPGCCRGQRCDCRRQSAVQLRSQLCSDPVVQGLDGGCVVAGGCRVHGQVCHLRVGRQSEGQLPCSDVRAFRHLSVVQDVRDVAGDWSFKHLYICFRRRLCPVAKASAKELTASYSARLDSCPDGEWGAMQFLVQDGHARSGHQVGEQVRHRAVQSLEGEPSKDARAGADPTQGHLGHALGREAGNEAVAMLRAVSSPQGPRGSGSAPRLPSWGWAAQLHLRLQEAVLLPRCADGGHVLPGLADKWISLSQKVSEGARHGDVVLRAETVG